MKKNTALRLATLLCLLASALVALQSCRKEVDYSHGNEIPSNFKQGIKSDDLQAYINANRAMELFSLDWQKAQQTTIGNKNVVRVPILNVDKTAQVFKSMGLVLNRSGSIQTDRTNGNTSLTVGNNTNYDAKHPPELFFIQQIGKSSLAAFLLNFVPDAKNEGNGENGIWTGKLVEWNLTGDTILVQEINKSKLSDIYALSKNLPPENAKAKQKQISHSNKQSGFWRDLWDIFSEFIGWVGSLFGMSERYYDPYDYGWEWRLTPNFDWLTGGGGGGGDGYTGAGYPIYNDYLPGYRPADVFPYEYPGNDPYTPYPGGPNFVTPVDPYALDYLQKEQATQITKNVVRAIEEQFWTEEPLTDYQLEVLSELCLEEFAAEYYNNTGEFAGILSMQPGDDDKPFWEFLKKKLRQLLGYEQPETPEEREQNERIYTNVKATVIGLRNINGGIRLIPGMSLFQAVRENEGYTAATVDLSVDLFGGTLLKFIGSPFLKLSNKYLYKVSELATKYPNIAVRLKSFSISEFNIIKRSNTEKVIIIGEKMEERILPATKDVFKKIFKNAETFKPSEAADLDFTNQLKYVKDNFGRDRLTDAEMRLTKDYRENVDWMIDKLNEGYNVIDIGPKVPKTIKSPSYEMERSFIYKK